MSQQSGECTAGASSGGAFRNQPSFFLKRHCQRRVDLTKFPGTGQNESGSHVRMTGKGDFPGRSKNSDVTCVAGFCRKDEGALGEVELTCDLLHLMIGKTVRVGQYGQRIPPEARLRKHITDVVSIFHESGG